MSAPEGQNRSRGPQPADIREGSGPRWLTIVKAVWAAAGEDNLGLIASGVAFYGFLAFVPTIAALVFSYGFFARPVQVARHISVVANLLPDEAARVVGAQLRDMVGTTKSQVGLGLFLSFGLALYGLTKGAEATVAALNVVFWAEETRFFFRQTAITLAVAAILVGIFLLAGIAISAFNLLRILLPDLAPGLPSRPADRFLAGDGLDRAPRHRGDLSFRPPCLETWLKPFGLGHRGMDRRDRRMFVLRPEFRPIQCRLRRLGSGRHLPHVALCLGLHHSAGRQVEPRP